MMDSHSTRHAVKRALAVLAPAALFFLLFAGSAFADTGSVSVSINGYGTVAVTTGTNGPSCTSPASNPQSNSDSCSAIDGPSYDACTSDGSGGSFCQVTLQATALAGWSFAGWSGDCSGTSATCTVDDKDTTCDPVAKPPCHTDYADSSVTASFTDTRAPTTGFSTAPTANTVVYSDTQSQTFTWSTDEDNENPTFSCKRDGGTYAGCSSGYTWSSISDGVHDFCVKGTDASGLAGSAVCRHWEQETNPSASISSHPASTSGPSVSFTYTSNKASHLADGSTLAYQCKLDGGAFGPCPAGGSSYTGLASGQHTFALQAVFQGALGGGAHTSAAASYTWTVDATPPDTTISGGPAAGSSTTDTSASFTLGSTEGGSTYECSLDGAPLAPCSATPSYFGLSVGPHTLEVVAIDAYGNQDPSPASRSWTVVTPPSSGGGGGAGGGTGGTPPVLRVTNPVLAMSSHASSHQKVLRRRGIAITVSCNAACTLKLGGTISIPGSAKVFKLRAAHASLVGAGSKSVMVKLPKAALATLRKALAAHRKASARITVSASAAGATPQNSSVSLKISR